MDISTILEGSSFFRGISHEGKRALGKICRRKSLSRGQDLFIEGAEGHSLWLLVDGAVKVYKLSPDGKESVIKIVKPGELFAEVILFERDLYPANASALKKSQVLSIPKREVLSLLDDRGFRADFIEMLMSRMRFLSNQVQYLSSFDVEQRLFRFLEEQGGRVQEISLNISKKDVASAIKTTPESLSRLLLRLKNDGVLEWKDKVVTLSSGFWVDH